MKVHVLFRDVLDLVPQSTVKLDDVTVGKITAIKLDGYTADVTIEIPRNLKIPSNERAEIRQTSLLGEKFVSLEKPPQPSAQPLANGDVIPLAHTGRNPEIEEVFKALSAVLTGGGVAQLKSIAHELNQATTGREQDIRSVLDQIHYFMGQLDQNKNSVLAAIDSVDRLARGLHSQEGTIKQTLDDLPAAVKSVNAQRADLIRMLRGLQHLSNVGVRVIKASKQATIDSLSDLAPVLNAFAKAGQDLPKALQIFPTYPFLDAAVGNSPTVARNLQMGDWVNLSILLGLDINKLTVPGLPDLKGAIAAICKQLPGQLSGSLAPVCGAVAGLAGALPSSNSLTDQLNNLLGSGATAGSKSATKGGSVGGLLGGGGGLLGSGSTTGGGSTSGSGSGSGTGSGGGLGGLLSGLGLGRAAPGAAFRSSADDDPFGLLSRADGSGIGSLLLQGVTG